VAELAAVPEDNSAVGLNRRNEPTAVTDDDEEPAEATDASDAANAGDPVAQGIAEVRSSRLGHLQQSIMKAQALLAFSAEANVAVPDTVVEGITDAQRAFGTEAWSLGIERAFWTAFREISGLVTPVTFTSLQWVATRGRGTTLLFIALGIASLVVLILGQIFWVYINNTSTQIRGSIERLNQKTKELVEIEATAGLLDRQLIFARERGVNPDELQQLEARNVQLRGKTEELATDIRQIRGLLAAQFVILADWAPEFGGDPKPQEPGWFDSDLERKAKLDNLAKWYEDQRTERGFEKEYLLAQADSILALMSTYVLPLLYGMLGTVAYILRSVSRGVQERVLTESSVLNFWVRIPLGMLSGVAIGWFLNEGTLPTGWDAVQPLALAFVAGYSVELIFTAMDRLVGAFTGRGAAATPAP
jgi:hypothetical protein